MYINNSSNRHTTESSGLRYKIFLLFWVSSKDNTRIICIVPIYRRGCAHAKRPRFPSSRNTCSQTRTQTDGDVARANAWNAWSIFERYSHGISPIDHRFSMHHAARWFRLIQKIEVDTKRCTHIKGTQRSPGKSRIISHSEPLVAHNGKYKS